MNRYEEGITQAPEKRLVKYPDLLTVSQNEIAPRERANVLVAVVPDSLPVIKTIPDFEQTFDSGRSRNAIIGLEVHGKHGLREAVVNGRFDSNGRVIESFEMQVEVENHTGMPIIIPENFGILRFFSKPPESVIKGDDLMREIMGGSIKIEGEYGTDWKIDEDFNAIFVKIEDKRSYIGDSEESYVLQEGRDFRKLARARYQDFPPKEGEVFSIGQTKKITIENPNLEMVLSEDICDVDGEVVERQINSVLIEPSTNWNVWTETVGYDPKEVTGPRFAKFTVVRNGMPKTA